MKRTDILIFVTLLLTIMSFTTDVKSSAEDIEELSPIREIVRVQGHEIDIPTGHEMRGSGTEADPFIIENLYINNTKDPGIWINNSHDHIIINAIAVMNNIWNRTDGIFISNSTNVTIVNSMVRGCYLGLHVDNSSDINIVGCDLSNNRYGIVAYSSPGLNITDCSIFGNLIDGIMISGSDNCMISFCDLISNSNRISNDAGIRITASSNFIIQGSLLQMNYGTGVYLKGPIKGGTLLDCDINYNNEAIIIEGCEDLRVQGIEMIINVKAMVVSELEGSIIADCWAYRNQFGMDFDGMHSSEIRRIEMEECGFGFRFSRSGVNDISGNVFIDSKDFDLELGDPMDDPSLTSQNLIVDNHFGSKGRSPPNVTDHGSENEWHKNGSGNIWSNIELSDEDGDGIGDEPLLIKGSAGSWDEFPQTLIPPTSVKEGEEKTPEPKKSGGGYLILLLISIIFATGLLMVMVALMSVDGASNDLAG